MAFQLLQMFGNGRFALRGFLVQLLYLRAHGGNDCVARCGHLRQHILIVCPVNNIAGADFGQRVLHTQR